MSTNEKSLVREEALTALSTFSAEGFAEQVGFGVIDGVAFAEVYGDDGEITATYRVKILIEAVQ